MRVTHLAVTAIGEVMTSQEETVLRVKGSGQEFVLAEPSGAESNGKSALGRLREALSRGEKVTSVTGRVAGWDGRFPDVLRDLGTKSSNSRPRLLVTDFAAKP
jgi:hypothetical protein